MKMLKRFSENSIRHRSATPLYHLSSKEVMEREDKYGAHNYKPLPVVIHKAKGK